MRHISRYFFVAGRSQTHFQSSHWAFTRRAESTQREIASTSILLQAAHERDRVAVETFVFLFIVSIGNPNLRTP